MKAILEFDLPEEAAEHQAALDGYKWKAVVDDMRQYLHTQEKYKADDPINAAFANEKLSEFICSYGLSLD